MFLGKFGGGKTISAVRRCYNICKTHEGVTVLKSIVLIDEIGSIFNSRDFAASKKSVPKPVYKLILQCRHRLIMLLGTVQRWNLLDKQLRDIADTITVCHSYFADPFARYTRCVNWRGESPVKLCAIRIQFEKLKKG